MSRYKSLIALNASVFLMMLGNGMIVVLLPQKIMDLSHSFSTVGYLASAFAVTYVLMQVPIGNLADRVGFKTLLTLGYLLCGLAALLYHWASTPALVLLGRMLQGAGEVPVWALAPALLSIQHANTKGKVIGIYNASFHIGLSVGPLLGLVLVRLLGQNNVAFLFYTVVSLAGGLIIYRFVENPSLDNAVKMEQFDLHSFWAFVTNHLTLIVLIGIALYGAGYGLAVSLIPAFLISAKGFNQASISIAFSLFYVAIGLSQLIAGPFSDKKGRRGFMIGGLICAAIGLASFSPLQQPWVTASLIFVSLGLGIFCVSSMAYLNESVSDSLKGTISGAYYLFWGLGYFSWPLAAGSLGNSFGLDIGFYVLSGLLAIETILLIVFGAGRVYNRPVTMQPSSHVSHPH